MEQAPTGRVYTPIYKHWWFWLGLVFLVAATFYVKRNIDWNAQYMSLHSQDYARAAAAKVMQYQEEQTKKAYREDTYGGVTPEETLKLFVDALDKKDFALAAKYYVPEKQQTVLKILTSAKTDAPNPFIEAYKTGKITSYKSQVNTTYEIDIIAQGEKIPFYVRFMKNPFTNKWKITEPA